MGFFCILIVMPDRLAILLQYLLPKWALTHCMGRLASASSGRLGQAVMRWFIKRYQVNMAEAANPDLSSYTSFNAFFTRALAPGLRPLAQADLVCPVDGAISQLGPTQQGRIFQAKGFDYSAQELLAGSADEAAAFDGGYFATLYLSPRDYHRIHMPCAGRLRRMVYVPGTLFSVNPLTVRSVPRLFARNERVVCWFESPATDERPPFEFVLVLVGATIVGSMATTWHGVVNPPRTGKIRRWDYSEQNTLLQQGQEMGRFLLGSTVVALFPQTTGLRFNPAWAASGAVRMGEAMGQLSGTQSLAH